jgi:hypothetical protein
MLESKSVTLVLATLVVEQREQVQFTMMQTMALMRKKNAKPSMMSSKIK